MRQSITSAEAYRRRIERGLARGLTRQEARGHGGLNAKPNKAKSQLPFNPKLEEALKQLRKQGATLSAAAKDAGVGRERLSQYIKTVAGAKRDGKIWRFDDRRIRRMAIIVADEIDPVLIRVGGFEEAHRAGLHWHEAGLALRDKKRRPKFQRRWDGHRIRDVEGRWYTLSTDFTQIFRAILTQEYSYERFYGIEQQVA